MVFDPKYNQTGCYKFLRNFEENNNKEVQYRSKILGPKYACNAPLRVRDANVCVFDTRMKCAPKGKSLVFMS